METTVSMGSILNFINSMSLSASNKKWLGRRLIEEAAREENKGNSERIRFKDKGISPAIADIHRGISIKGKAETDDIRLEYLMRKYQ